MKIATLLASAVLAGASATAETTFSATQKWDKNFSSLLESESLFQIEWKSIDLPKPPDSTVEVTYLLELQKLRTPEIIKMIKAESNDALDPGKYLDPDLGENGGHEKTVQLCKILQFETGGAILHQAKRFDRARPASVSSEIITVIGTPGFPSYPSGHACQFYALAYFLAAVNPEKATDYLAKAAAITKNRESAGIHFPSDSVAGKVLAKLMIRKLLQDKRFQSAFLAASEEWPGPNPITKMVALNAYTLPDSKPTNPTNP